MPKVNKKIIHGGSKIWTGCSTYVYTIHGKVDNGNGFQWGKSGDLLASNLILAIREAICG